MEKESKRERERGGGDRCNAIDTSHCALGRTQGVVFIDINGKRRGDSRLFRGCVEKFNRRMRSDASVMHRSRASVGANLLCARGGGGGDGRTKETRGFPGTEHDVPLVAITEHSSREKRPLLSLSSIVTDGLFCPLVYGVIKKKSRIVSKDRPTHPLDREKETILFLIIVNPCRKERLIVNLSFLACFNSTSDVERLGLLIVYRYYR